MYLQNGKEQHTCVILAKSSTGRAHGLSGSLRRFRPGLSRSRSQGWEWHLGSWGGRARRTEDGVLQADEGEAGTGGGWDGICGGTGGGGKNWTAASRMSTGEREKRLCGGGGGWSGEGEEEHEDGEGKKQQQAPPPAPSLGSQGNIHGSGESGERARLKKVGLEEECSEELSEELGARSGHGPPAPPPLWHRRFTGVQTLEALGRQVYRQRERSSGTDSERQWRLGGGGGGGGGPGKDRSVTEVLGVCGQFRASPSGRWLSGGPRGTGPGGKLELSTPCRLAFEGGQSCQ